MSRGSRGHRHLPRAVDLAVVRHMSDRISVMYPGRVVEEGRSVDVYDRPMHPYTASLLSATPVPDPGRQRTRRRLVLKGDVPSPLEVPSGCRFRTRYPYAMAVCAVEDPPAFLSPGGTTTHCHQHTYGPRLQGAPISALQP